MSGSDSGDTGTAVDETGGERETETETETAGTLKWPVVGVILAVLWLFVRGVPPGETVEATLRTVLGEFLIGLAVGLPTAFALRRYYTPRVSVGRSLRAVPYAGIYLALFIRELVTANVDVAYRVLAPSMPIRPDVIAIPLRVESDAAITTIANSITLTPGTLTMDHDAETNTLYVHAIAAKDRDSVVEPIRIWEDYALIVFEGRDPNVEVPRSPYGVSTDGTDGASDARERAAGADEGKTGDGAEGREDQTERTRDDVADPGGDDATDGGDGRGR